MDLNYIEAPVYDYMVAFDFDGTLFKEEWPAIGEAFYDIHDIVHYCHNQGFINVLYTLREGQLLEDALEVIEAFKLPFHLINCNAPHRIEKYYDSRKIGFDLLIDDRCAGGLLTKYEYINYIDEGFMNTSHGELLTDKQQLSMSYKRNHLLC